MHVARAGHGRPAHAARHQGGVRGLAALGGQDALRGVEARDVVGLGEGPDQHDGLARLGGGDGLLGREDDGALGRARRGGDAAGDDLVARGGVEGGVQQGVQRAGVDRGDRLGRREQTLRHRVDGEADGRLRRPLGGARLQHVQPPLLDGELGVLDVLVVALERPEDLHQLGVRGGHPVRQLGEVARRAHARDHVLALRVDQEVAARLGCAGDLVAGEGDARGGRRAAVAVDHPLHVDRGAPLLRDPIDLPVGDRSVAHPGVEHGQHRLAQLGARLGREAVERLEAAGQLAQRVRVELGVEADAALGLQARDLVLEALAGDAAHDVPEHLDEAAVGVPGEALVARRACQTLDRVVVEAQVEDGVHHARHRVAGAAADGDQERVARIAEPAPGLVLEAGERLVDRRVQALRGDAAASHVGDAGLRGDGEAGRDPLGPEQAGHLGDVGALAAEQVAHLPRSLVEVVDPARDGRGGHLGLLALSARSRRHRQGQAPMRW